MARKKKPEEPEKPENSERWLLTYSDMITLLMAFFIVLYAISNVEKSKAAALSESLNEAFNIATEGQSGAGGLGGGGGSASGQTLRPSAGTGLSPKASSKKTPFRERANSTLRANINQGSMRISTEARGVVVALSGDVFFAKGDVSLNADSLQQLEQVADLLRGLPQDIVVEGHTDTTPVERSDRYASNLMLSAARAVSVAEALEMLGVPKERISAAGYGDSRPLKTNDTPEGRAYNRRVDILIKFDGE
jgi:chemotaxis protein MotB